MGKEFQKQQAWLKVRQRDERMEGRSGEVRGGWELKPTQDPVVCFNVVSGQWHLSRFPPPPLSLSLSLLHTHMCTHTHAYATSGILSKLCGGVG